ncbi:hypothetical protein CGSMWGv6420B_05211 [Gardnerella vaginalis 6420B]|nr:hypothetical protein CGSMWGv6420B_05211 [Gardnerella vaginalis 6420B]
MHVHEALHQCFCEQWFRSFASVLLRTLLMKLCSNALQTAIIYCLVNFNSIALQTLSIYCLKNTSVIAAAHAIPGTPTVPKTTVIGINVWKIGIAWSSNIKAER